MSKVFMDGGSGINIIYASTLRRMKISLAASLVDSDTSFHGIVPGKAVYPLEKMHLDVGFGDTANFRKERLEFEVVDWPSQYHVILGRPAFARFMAVPHYAYLLLRMPGPHDTITVQGDYRKSDSCDRDFNTISESFGMHEELSQLSSSTD